MTVFVIETIDYPSDCYIAGAASTFEACIEWAKKQHPDILEWDVDDNEIWEAPKRLRWAGTRDGQGYICREVEVFEI